MGMVVGGAKEAVQKGEIASPLLEVREVRGQNGQSTLQGAHRASSQESRSFFYSWIIGPLKRFFSWLFCGCFRRSDEAEDPASTPLLRGERVSYSAYIDLGNISSDKFSLETFLIERLSDDKAIQKAGSLWGFVLTNLGALLEAAQVGHKHHMAFIMEEPRGAKHIRGIGYLPGWIKARVLWLEWQRKEHPNTPFSDISLPSFMTSEEQQRFKGEKGIQDLRKDFQNPSKDNSLSQEVIGYVMALVEEYCYTHTPAGHKYGAKSDLAIHPFSGRGVDELGGWPFYDSVRKRFWVEAVPFIPIPGKLYFYQYNAILHNLAALYQARKTGDQKKMALIFDNLPKGVQSQLAYMNAQPSKTREKSSRSSFKENRLNLQDIPDDAAIKVKAVTSLREALGKTSDALSEGAIDKVMQWQHFSHTAYHQYRPTS